MMGGSMKLARRHLVRLAAGAVALPVTARLARTQTYPIRPITMIVPFAAGGTTDVLARVLAERMRRVLGQPLIIENVGGADGSIGTGRVARANPDGHTIELGFLGTHVLNGAFYSLPYDVLNDFAPIAPLVMFPEILFARKTMPARDLWELIAWLKANPSQASAGIQTAGIRLITEFFQKQTGTKLNFIPYRGTGPAVQDLVAGQIDLLFAPPDALPQVAAGNIKAYVVTSDARLAIAPAIPTVAEAGLPDLGYLAWFAFFAPGARHRTSSVGSMQRWWKLWPIRRCARDLSISASRFSRASDRPLRRWTRWSRPRLQNGGRSSGSWGSRANDEALTGPTVINGWRPRSALPAV
jgi:tripartite-type tricarboxylate transporter receptor subunit TctC